MCEVGRGGGGLKLLRTAQQIEKCTKSVNHLKHIACIRHTTSLPNPSRRRDCRKYMSRGCISMGQRDLLQDCGKPWYVEDYNSFYTAIKKLYPNITLIANCNMGGDAPTDLWDWHSYDESFTM